MAHTFIISDESLNNLGFWILTEGIDFNQFKKNPIMYWMHARPSGYSQNEPLPIGTWENLRVKDRVLLADAVFDKNDDFAKKIEQKVVSGVIKMASPGLEPIELSDDPFLLKVGQSRQTLIRSKLKEVSIVDRGANDNALKLYAVNDKEINLSDDENSIIPFINKKNMKLNKENLKQLNLADTATDAQVNKAISEAMAKAKENETMLADKEAKLVALKYTDKQLSDKDTEIEKLKDTVASIEKLMQEKARTDFEALLNDPKKKLTKEQKENYLELFDESGSEVATKIVTTLPNIESLHQVPQHGDGDVNLADEWDKHHRNDTLAGIKDSDPDYYAQMHAAKYASK